MKKCELLRWDFLFRIQRRTGLPWVFCLNLWFKRHWARFHIHKSKNIAFHHNKTCDKMSVSSWCRSEEATRVEMTTEIEYIWVTWDAFTYWNEHIWVRTCENHPKLLVARHFHSDVVLAKSLLSEPSSNQNKAARTTGYKDCSLIILCAGLHIWTLLLVRDIWMYAKKRNLHRPNEHLP